MSRMSFVTGRKRVTADADGANIAATRACGGALQHCGTLASRAGQAAELHSDGWRPLIWTHLPLSKVARRKRNWI